MIYVNEKDLVIPGEILAEEEYYSGRGTFEENGKVCSSLLGLVSLRNKKLSVIPLKSKYIPKKGDVVIGKISDVKFSMWDLDIHSPYSAMLPASEVFGREKKELSQVFDIGDVLFLRIVDVDEVKKVRLGLKGRGMGKFKGGIIVDIAPTKVPRLIGKKGSMINMIKDKTGCKIVVGQNGLVWIKGKEDMEQLTKDIIKLIEKEAHTSGLTDRIKNRLSLIIDGEIPQESNINHFEDNAVVDVNDSFDDGLKKPELQDFKSELQEEIAKENLDNLENNDNLISDNSKNYLVNKENKNLASLKDYSEEDSVSNNILDEISDKVHTEDSILDNVSEEDSVSNIISDNVHTEDSISDDISDEDSVSDLNSNNESLENKHLVNQKNKEIKFSKKTSFLDTFDYIKQQERTKKPSFSDLSQADNSESPTLNIPSNNKKKKKSPHWRKSL